MSSPVISVVGLSKCFKQYARPVDRMIEFFTGQSRGKDFWALRNVSFEVNRGETVGIVGRNGSGKSTLLQILTGTLPPSAGSAVVSGKVSALLELGTGFNPEFTGRENVFLNAQILGLSVAEVTRKFDEIVAFSEIAPFIDQPVKTYSSGMYMRLAFSVAVSVEPDVLIVDEALAVGDEAFQRKCYSRLDSFKKTGGTILLVTHSASTIVELCDRALLLDSGERLLFGKPKSVTTRYHKLIYARPEKVKDLRDEIRNFDLLGAIEESISLTQTPPTGMTGEPIESERFDAGMLPKSTTYYESNGARIADVRIENMQGQKVNVLHRGREYFYTYDVHFDKSAFSVRFANLLKTTTGFEIGGMHSHTEGDGIEFIEAGTVVSVRFKMKMNLLPNMYFANAGALAMNNGSEVFLHRAIDVYMFRVITEEKPRICGIVDLSTGDDCLVTMKAADSAVIQK
jgi:lipopolysaccharide transport system ATP-binding protein